MAKTTNRQGPRQRILETALDLFYTKGYLATGINEVIQRAGVAKASFYQHFPSKEALCLAYLEERHRIWGGWLEEALARPRTAWNRLLAPFDFLAAWLPECGYRGCAFLNIASEVPDHRHAIRRLVDRHKSELRERFRALAAELKEADPAYRRLRAGATGDALYLLFEGAIAAAQNFHDVWPVPAARRSFESMVKSSV